MNLKKTILIFASFICINFNHSLFAQDQSFLAVSVAAFDVIQQHEPSVEGRLEFRLDKSNWKFDPFVGVMGNSDEAKHVYVGILYNFIFQRRIIITPSFAPGLYFRGKSKDLSFVLEFRSQLEIAYCFRNSMKIGLSFNHISNASIKPPNIGVESLALTFIFPI
jgi:hypothetical protein